MLHFQVLDLRENPTTVYSPMTSLIVEVTDDDCQWTERQGHVSRENIYIFGHSLKTSNLADFFTQRQIIKVLLAPDQDKRLPRNRELATR